MGLVIVKRAGESKLETQPQSIGIHLMDWGLPELTLKNKIKNRGTCVSFLKSSTFVETYILEPHTNLTSYVSTCTYF